jgi:hypothetical protein
MHDLVSKPKVALPTGAHAIVAFFCASSPLWSINAFRMAGRQGSAIEHVVSEGRNERAA